MQKASEVAKSVEWLWSPDSSDEVELAFLARSLIQVTLPHSDPGNVPLWIRKNGNLTLVMARTDVDEAGNLIGYPYGSLPRLLLVVLYVVTCIKIRWCTFA